MYIKGWNKEIDADRVTYSRSDTGPTISLGRFVLKGEKTEICIGHGTSMEFGGQTMDQIPFLTC
jgi:hypothetical protein